jgi:hypothetical protein
MALGVYGRARFYQLSGQRYLGLVHAGGGDVASIEIASGRVALITDAGVCRVLRVDPHLEPDAWSTIYEGELALASQISLAYGDAPAGRRRVRASLSGDGELLAVREQRKTLTVIDLSSGKRQSLSGHTDRINLVRFIQGGRVLVTADNDNRVVFWPRAASRMADTIIRVKRRRRARA